MPASPQPDPFLFILNCKCFCQRTMRAATLAATVFTAYAHGQESSSAPPPPRNSPIAIVPTDVAASVSGAAEITLGKAVITGQGAVTSGPRTTEVLLPHRGTLRVCASTTVNLSTDKSVPSADTPGLMIALDHGAIETSFATGHNSDILLTPDFRILIGGQGSSELKVRLGEHGDTCVDNPGADAPYVVVSSVFEGGAYRVQPGQRVMFQHGSLSAVVDQEKEPCGCPIETHPNTNEFPLAQSAGLAPLPKPSAPTQAPPPVAPDQPSRPLTEPLVYSAPPAQKPPETAPAPPPAPVQPAPVQPTAVAPAPAPKKKPGFFGRIGGFFKRVFGAD